MSQNIQPLLTFLLYIAFFGWVGWRRGTFRELVVLVTAVISWVVLQGQGDRFVRIADLGGKLAAFIMGRDLNNAFAISSEFKPLFLFGIWVFIIFCVYIVTNLFLKTTYNDSWSVLLGIANGLFFGAVLLPRLIAPMIPGINYDAFMKNVGVMQIFRNAYELISTRLGTLWRDVTPSSRSILFLLLVTLLLLLAATSLRGTRARES